MTSDELLRLIREKKPLTLKQELTLIIKLAIPAILAQISTILMFYIDASMVGSLGANASASIGLITPALWVIGGSASMFVYGYSVQVAQAIGANDFVKARSLLRQALIPCASFAFILMSIALILAKPLPALLGGAPELHDDSSAYFMIFALAQPFALANYLSSSMLRCSGNIKLPSLLNVLMCILDVCFNFIFIFDTHHLEFLGFNFTIYGADLGVRGAALGTALAFVCTSCCTTYFLMVKSPILNLLNDHKSFKVERKTFKRSLKISLPMIGEHLVISGAQIVSMLIVAPLGPISIAAHSFAITAESLCYMPGFGLSDAATTLVGQSIGAKRKKLTINFARQCVFLGMIVMSFMGLMLYIFAPVLMGIMTPVDEISDLGTHILRIEAFAEPLYAASIVAYGVFVGAGDTLRPCLLNFFSMWAVRLTLAYILAQSFGLVGVWIAMAIELSFRGLAFLYYLFFIKWYRAIYNKGDHNPLSGEPVEESLKT